MAGPVSIRAMAWREAIIAGVVNAVLNGGIAWFKYGGQPQATMGGINGLIVDTLATGFLLGLLIPPIMARVTATRIRTGKVEMPGARVSAGSFDNVWIRGIALGAIGFAVALVGLVGWLYVAQSDAMAGLDATIWKTALTGVLGFAVCYVSVTSAWRSYSPAPVAA